MTTSDTHGGAPLRTAVIGYGTGGAVFHAPVIDAEPKLALSAIVTSDPARSAAALHRYPRVTVHPTVNDLWEHADDVDLVVVTTPTRHHASLAQAALRRGISVVVDKPFTVTSEQAAELESLAGESGTLLTVFQNRRYDGDFRTVRKLIEDGALGTVHRFESRFERWRPEPKTKWTDQGGPGDAGGIAYDLGSHLIDQAVTLFGPPVSVYAEINTRRANARTDDDAFIALTHGNDVRSHLWMSALAPHLGPRFRVLGDKAGYVKDGLDPQEAALGDGAVPGGPGWGAEPEDRWGLLSVGTATTAVPTEPGDYPAYYREVAEAVLTGGPPPVTAAQARRVIEIIEACYRSQEQGAVIDL
jgi:predicted dehydrogenase